MSVLLEVAEKKWPSIKVLIDEVLAEHWMNPFTSEMIRYQIETGGKKIRPTLVVGIHRAFGGNDSDALPFAAAVELIHNASLVHDDIQDQDEFRRGKQAAWKKYSTDQAINLGDILFTLAFEVFMKSPLEEKTKLEIVKLSMRAVSELVNGQIQEIVFRESSEVSVNDYLAMVGGKTGSLFRLASKGAFILTGNGSDNYVGDLNSLGSHLGNMFQVRDDIIDIIGLKEGRAAGRDVMEGKISVLTSISMSRLDRNEKLNLIEMLRFPREKKNKNIIAKVASIYRKTDAFREAYTIYESEREKIYSIPVMKNNARLGAFISEILDHMSLPLVELNKKF